MTAAVSVSRFAPAIFRCGAAAAIILIGVTHTTNATAQNWVGSWGASPVATNPGNTRFPPVVLANQTIRQFIRVSAGGARVRLRLSNEFGSKPLEVGAVRVSLVDADGRLLPGSDRPVTFGGSPLTVVPAGAPALSDAIDLAVTPLSMIAVSVYFPTDTGPCTCHTLGLQEAQISGVGDFTAATAFPVQSTTLYRVFLARLEVDAPGSTIVALGDSITDGQESSQGRNARWTDRLADRLEQRRPTGSARGVVNAGISANQVLGAGAGQNALARFDRDVLSVSGVRYVVIFEGVNDIGASWGAPINGIAPTATLEAPSQAPTPVFRPPARRVTATDLIAGYRQIIDRAHARGVKVIGATITPYEGARYWSPEGEAVRQDVNAWIRTSGAFDGVLDFDAVWRDPARKTRIREGFHSGDFLHGSDEGYRALADSVDLAIFD